MPDIDFQKIELNLIPKKGDEPVVFYASQYETARPFIAVLKWGDSEFAPGVDYHAEIDIRKNDDNLVVITDDVSIDNNEVSVILPVQALTCIGKNLGQVKIYSSDDHLIAALNFILEVQPDPLAGGVDSETAIDNLTTQIEAIAEEVIGDDYYNKTETDALLADKADKSELPDMTDYYTKTQTDNLLNDKADRTDLATLASKAEVTQAISDEDTALKNWVSSNFATSGYVATHYYTKLQVDDLLIGLMPVGSASGNPCSFNTEIAASLQALTADIVCGGGGGTPSTPIPLVGHSELNIYNGVNNFLTETTFSQGSIDAATGEELTSPYRVRTDFIWLEEGNYLISSPNGFDIVADIYDENKSFKNGESYTVWASTPRKISILSGGRYARVLFRKPNNLAITPSEISGEILTKIINTFTVAFGQTVYGGVYDKSGRLTITHAKRHVTSSDDLYSSATGTNFHQFISQGFTDAKNSYNAICDKLKTIEINERETETGMISYSSDTIFRFSFLNDTGITTLQDFKDWLDSIGGLDVCYELATPIVIDVPSISVFAENGTNNIISDCGGNVSVSYKDTIQHYIDTRL